MASVRKLDPTEIRVLRRRGRRIDLTPYRAALRGLPPGAGLEVMPIDGEMVVTLKRRIAQAAAAEGTAIRWLRKRRNGPMVLEVVARP